MCIACNDNIIHNINIKLYTEICYYVLLSFIFLLIFMLLKSGIVVY